MNILIVSGFLGAGKTTFIKELIHRTGANPVILENEYGDNSIDAGELRSQGQGDKKLEILEFMEGCVCCTMKDSFVNSVLTIFSGLSPEYLVIEPTGVGKLSSILENLKPILHDNINILDPIVVLSPSSFRQNMNEWGELYKDQIINAKTVVFSKCEHEDSDVLEKTSAEIKKLNPGANIISSHYTTQSDEWWRSLFALSSQNVDVVSSKADSSDFSQITLNNVILQTPAQLILLLEDCLRGEFGQVARAKGNINVGGESLRFDLADGLYSITNSEQNDNQCVFIGKNLDKIMINKRMGTLLTRKSSNISIRGRAMRSL